LASLSSREKHLAIRAGLRATDGHGCKISFGGREVQLNFRVVAVNQNGITALNVKLDVSNLSPGAYVLAIGGPRHERRKYPMVVK
jgi:hypothetical protein